MKVLTNTNRSNDILTKIQNNWATVLSLAGKIENTETKAGALELCDKLHDRLAVCPASSKTEYVGAFPGGLVFHSLNVLKIMKDMRKALELEDKVSTDSLIVLGLFHDIGKLGNEDNDYYLPQSSEYHRNRGNPYEFNQDLLNIPVATRSLWWLNRFSIWLSENEIHALNTLNVKGTEIVSYVPSLRDPWEAYLLQSAVRAACLKYGGFKSILDTP